MGGHKKHKKEKKHKREKKKKRRSSTSSDSSSIEDEWVEKETGNKKSLSPPAKQLVRDDWLSNADDLFATVSRTDIKPKKEKVDLDRVNIDEMGKSDRELNPYWKDGGTGLPQELKDSNKLSGSVGDLGLGWLRKALERAKQTALEENKSLEEVVAPVWGSLDKLQNLIKEAEDKINTKSRPRYETAGPSRSDFSYHNKYRERDDRSFRKPDSEDRCRRDNDKEWRKDGTRNEWRRDSNKDEQKKDNYRDEQKRNRDERRDDIERDKRRDSKSFRKAESEDSGSYDRANRRTHFRKPDDSDDKPREFRRQSDSDSHNDARENKSDRSKRSSDINERLERLRGSRDMPRSGWKKTKPESEPSSSKERFVEPERDVKPRSPSPEVEKITEREDSPQPQGRPDIITQDEMNKLAAQILKAEMFGNEAEVKELKDKLKKAQAWLSGKGKSQAEEKEVILTHTDRRGFTQPLASSSKEQPTTKKRSKFDTHQEGKRVRYFKDDDNYSLQDLVHQEKFVSVADQNEMYAILYKGTGQKMDDDDFEEGGGREKSEEWVEFNKRQRAALESTAREKKLDSCRFCLDSNTVNRRLVISLMDKVYLSVPSHQSLTEGHCLITPIQHTPCQTLLDEDVWDEVMDLRRLVVKMFLEEDKDVIFYESAKNLNKFPHMVLNCIPVPKEVGDDAPIYFKKALLECETEWSNNKKVIDLKGRDVRKAVPKGLSYFAVDFGLQSGYAHVIEDERFFPKNFAEEIIGGMMDMDHSIWRKQKKDDQEIQIAKTQQFIKKFKEFTSKKQL